MKASVLIAELKELIAEFGDLEVRLEVDDRNIYPPIAAMAYYYLDEENYRIDPCIAISE